MQSCSWRSFVREGAGIRSAKRGVGLLAWALAGVLALALLELLLRARHRRSELAAAEEGLYPLAGQPDPAELAGHVRVVALGDSITHGTGLPAGQCYPSILEAHLRSRWPARPITLINAGLPGQTALQGLQRVHRDVIRYRPALTLIAFGINDASLRRTRADAWREEELLPAGLSSRLRHLHLYRTLAAQGRRMGDALGVCRADAVEDEPVWQPRVSLPAFRAALIRLVRRIRRRTDSQIVLMTAHPVSSPDVPALLEYNAIVRRVASETGAGLADIERGFADRDMSQLLDWDGIHLTESGHRVLAGLLFESLCEQGGCRMVDVLF